MHALCCLFIHLNVGCNLISIVMFNLNRKHTILSEKRFDFLKDLVANIADVQADEEGAENVAVCSRNTDIEPGAKTRGRYVM